MAKEANLLNLTEVAFFPTVLSKEERDEAYLLFKENGIISIPFVHLRTDMDNDEIDFLIKEFNTKIFNIHPFRTHKPEHDLTPHAQQIYIETQIELEASELKKFAGICIDISHLEQFEKTSPDVFVGISALLKTFPVGCAHISAVRKIPEIFPDRTKWAFHYFEDLADFDYVKKYQSILPPIVALEIENPLTEQLKAKEYILNSLKN